MALSGVRSSWLMLARNSLLAWLAPSARIFSASYLRASSDSCSWLRSRLVTARRSSSSWVLSAVMSAAVTTSPPSAVERSEICTHRPSANCASRTPRPPAGAGASWRIARTAARSTISRLIPEVSRLASSWKKLRKLRLHMTSRPCRSQSTKASEKLSMASRRRPSAACARACASRSSVTSKATPMIRANPPSGASPNPRPRKSIHTGRAPAKGGTRNETSKSP